MPPEWVWNALVKCKVLIAIGSLASGLQVNIGTSKQTVAVPRYKGNEVRQHTRHTLKVGSKGTSLFADQQTIPAHEVPIEERGKQGKGCRSQHAAFQVGHAGPEMQQVVKPEQDGGENDQDQQTGGPQRAGTAEFLHDGAVAAGDGSAVDSFREDCDGNRLQPLAQGGDEKQRRAQHRAQQARFPVPAVVKSLRRMEN